MIRILIDELGDGHKDIILKIDSLPAFAHLGDLYYLANFLTIDLNKIDNVPTSLGIAYLKYFKDNIKNTDRIRNFIIFNISD